MFRSSHRARISTEAITASSIPTQGWYVVPNGKADDFGLTVNADELAGLCCQPPGARKMLSVMAPEGVNCTPCTT